MNQAIDFAALGLSGPVLQAITGLGYEQPTPIQAQSIPPLLAGRNLLGTAQTGTGKTAAFALPLLSRIDTTQGKPQVLVLAPTRELAIQVAEAFQSYARHIKNFHVTPIYGGQDIRGQLKALQRGSDIVVGTPGRILDHLRRGSLKLGDLQAVVLDEADEMLRMGFIDDIETILSKTPEACQRALFSATMPAAIRRVAATYLGDAEEVRIVAKTSTVETTVQQFLIVHPSHKLDTLTRILEVEEFDGMIIFVRTKSATVELAEKLEARGFSSCALNGDLSQALREQTINRFKRGTLDIMVATDVAARGLDVERVSHVINFDIPYDTESYVHRIGRTGRAGREGKAILFVSPKERRLLNAIEKATRQPLTAINVPTGEQVSEQRITRFQTQILEVMQNQDLTTFRELIEQLAHDTETDIGQIAAALVWQAQKERPLFPKLEALPNSKDWAARGDKRPDKRPGKRSDSRSDSRSDNRSDNPFESRSDNRSDNRAERPGKRPARKDDSAARGEDTGVRREASHSRKTSHDDIATQRYRIEVGEIHGVKPGDIVGALANEAGIEGQYIGRIKIDQNFSTVDLPDGMPKEIFQHLQRVRVRQQPMNITLLSTDGGNHVDTRASRLPRPDEFSAPAKSAKSAKSTKPSKPSASADARSANTSDKSPPRERSPGTISRKPVPTTGKVKSAASKKPASRKKAVAAKKTPAAAGKRPGVKK